MEKEIRMFLRQAGGLDGGHEGRLGAGREVCPGAVAGVPGTHWDCSTR